MKDLIAVTIGDVEGIGIHLLLKEWYKSSDPSVNYISTFLKN